MTVIDIGPGATNRGSFKNGGVTLIDLNNSSNDTGILDTIETWFIDDANSFKCGTFYGSDTDYTSRDYEYIGNVTSGSKQTFSGLNCSVSAGDFLGQYHLEIMDRIEADASGYAGVYTKNGDQFGTGTQTYTENDGDAISIYATGATPVPPFTNAIPAMLAFLMN